MLKEDFASFEAAMGRLEDIYGKEMDDDAVQGYWQALRDLPFQRVLERIESHIRFGKFFPKPAELRPKEQPKASARDAAMDAAFREGEARAIRNLEEQRRLDPEKWAREVNLRKLDRIIATTDPSSPIYAAALIEWHKVRGPFGHG
jgi:hypothetical protein